MFEGTVSSPATSRVTPAVLAKREEVKSEVVESPARRAKAEPVHQRSSIPVKHAGAVELGRRGGLVGGAARSALLSPERRSEIAKAAAAARWGRRT